jgi:hypothetical protein
MVILTMKESDSSNVLPMWSFCHYAIHTAQGIVNCEIAILNELGGQK